MNNHKTKQERRKGVGVGVLGTSGYTHQPCLILSRLGEVTRVTAFSAVATTLLMTSKVRVAWWREDGTPLSYGVT